MALSNLIVEKLEHFGGIDLKANYRKYFGNALGISIAIHLLVILFYVGYSWFTASSDANIPHARIHSIAELAPPPSTQDNPDQPPPVPPPPSADVVKPNLGVPVPVPDAVAPQVTLPNMNEPTPPAAVQSQGSGPVTLEPPKLDIQAPKEEEPKEGEFVDVEEEPNPVTPIEKLIVYPEAAKRANLEGKVVVDALISKEGKVEKVNVLKADYDVFKQAAVDAIMKAKFTPARQNGSAVKLWITRTITFKLIAGH